MKAPQLLNRRRFISVAATGAAAASLPLAVSGGEDESPPAESIVEIIAECLRDHAYFPELDDYWKDWLPEEAEMALVETNEHCDGCTCHWTYLPAGQLDRVETYAKEFDITREDVLARILYLALAVFGG